jgi:hypothetical protein
MPAAAEGLRGVLNGNDKLQYTVLYYMYNRKFLAATVMSITFF